MGRFFDTPFKKGMPLSAKGFARGIMRLAEAWERLRIVGGYTTWDEAGHIPTLHVGSSGAWDGTAPTGYEWEELSIVTDSGIRKRKVLVEIPPIPSTDIEWDSDDARLILQVKDGTTDAGKLRLDKGFFKA